jgi:hypothetical protein
MPSERSPFGSPVEPISPPPKPACQRAWVEAPGTAPGSERLISMPIYRRSPPRERHSIYRAKSAEWEGAAGLNGLTKARRKTDGLTRTQRRARVFQGHRVNQAGTRNATTSASDRSYATHFEETMATAPLPPRMTNDDAASLIVSLVQSLAVQAKAGVSQETSTELCVPHHCLGPNLNNTTA